MYEYACVSIDISYAKYFRNRKGLPIIESAVPKDIAWLAKLK